MKMFTNVMTALCAVATIFTFTGCASNDSLTAPETTIASESTDVETTTTTETTTAIETSTTTSTEATTVTTTTVATTEQTTTSVADTETTDAVNSIGNKLAYHKYYAKELSANDYVYLKNTHGDFMASDVKTWYFYDFNDNQIAGISHDGKESRVACYNGFRAEINDNRDLVITCTKNCADVDIRYENNNVSPKFSTRTNENGKLVATADLWDSSFPNGFYTITGTFDEFEASLYLFVNCASDNADDYHFYLCVGEEHYWSEDFNPVERRKYINELLASSGVTPENAISNRNYNYPCMATADNNDVQYWIDKSHEILAGHENAKNSSKALLLHDWMTSNLKYDYYKVNVLRTPRYYVNYILDPSQYVSKNYTGVCLDFSSIYTIMCRENGIPCVVLNDSSHAWNAICISDTWYEVDLTRDTNRLVYEENTNYVTSATCYYCYEGFCTPYANDHTPDSATKFCW